MSERLTPRGLIAFWRCYRAQWKNLSYRSRRDAMRAAWKYGPVR